MKSFTPPLTDKALTLIAILVIAFSIASTIPPNMMKVYATSNGDEEDEEEDSNSESERAVPSESRSENGGDEDSEEEDEGIKVFTDNPPDDPLYMTSYSISKDSLLDNDIINIVGEVKNNGTEAADFVKLTATLYNSNNKTFGSEVAFTDPTTLEPGQSGPFEMNAGLLKKINVDEVQYIKFHLDSQ